MFTIKEAANRAGLNPDRVRAWERRYGVVRPKRTNGGYRLYSEADIARLTAMRRLVEQGWRAREAADRVVADEVERSARAEASIELFSKEPAGPPRTVALEEHPGRLGMHGISVRDTAHTERFVAAAARVDTGALAQLLDGYAAAGRFEMIVEDLIFPSLRAVGDAWAAGAVSVAGEHVASEAVLRWLAKRYDGAARERRRADVLVGLPPGAHHELGALAFAVALRRRGLSTVYLGANLPRADWVLAAEKSGAQLAVIGAVMPDDVAAAAEVAEALSTGHRSGRSLHVAFGGPSAQPLESYGRVLPAGLDDAAAAAAELLEREPNHTLMGP